MCPHVNHSICKIIAMTSRIEKFVNPQKEPKIQRMTRIAKSALFGKFSSEPVQNRTPSRCVNALQAADILVFLHLTVALHTNMLTTTWDICSLTISRIFVAMDYIIREA